MAGRFTQYKLNMAVKVSDRYISRFPEHGTFMTFVEDYLLPNKPCVFGESFTAGWKARQKWRNADGNPNFDYLEKEFGSAMVPVADCGHEEFSAHPKTEMSFREYINYWRSKVNFMSSGSDTNTQLLYLKDWHFVKDFPNYCAYTVLEFFASDWLNEAWHWRHDVTDDYQFVYMGPKGTWTPFHADVLRSYSWSANVCGSKEWLFYPPGEEDHLRDKYGHLPFDVTSADLADSALYPNACSSHEPIRVLQRSGEIIFVPSGWHHQVRNIEDTISINHNWTNAFAVRHTWTHLQNELRLVHKELDDCKTMDGWSKQCQVVLKASAGMDYWEFAQFLCLISRARLNTLRDSYKSNLLEYFDDLETYISKLLTGPPEPLTFITTSEEFAAVKAHDKIESIIRKYVSNTESGFSSTSIPLKKLFERLPKFLQDRLEVVLKNNAKMFSFAEFVSLVFRLYELNVIDILLQEVLGYFTYQ